MLLLRKIHKKHRKDNIKSQYQNESVGILGPFKYYVNNYRWVGGQSNIYAYSMNGLFLFTTFVY
jgi:hypothetical protein